MRVFRAVLCVLMLCFVGCGGAISGVKKDSKTPQYLYGQGSGSSFEVAKAEAIKDLSTNLQVSVKYNAVDNTTQRDDRLTRSGYSNISLESSLKNLPEIEITQNKKIKNKYEVQVRLDKNKLIQSVHLQVSNNAQELSGMLGECGATNVMNHQKFVKIFKEYQKNLSFYRILSGDSGFQDGEFRKFASIAARLPRYNIRTSNVLNVSDVNDILRNELQKFVSQDVNAPVANVTLSNNAGRGGLVASFTFFGCKGSFVESELDSMDDFSAKSGENGVIKGIRIDTHLSERDLSSSKGLQRLGPIIYKGLMQEIDGENARY